MNSVSTEYKKWRNTIFKSHIWCPSLQPWLNWLSISFWKQMINKVWISHQWLLMRLWMCRIQRIAWWKSHMRMIERIYENILRIWWLQSLKLFKQLYLSTIFEERSVKCPVGRWSIKMCNLHSLEWVLDKNQKLLSLETHFDRMMAKGMRLNWVEILEQILLKSKTSENFLKKEGLWILLLKSFLLLQDQVKTLTIPFQEIVLDKEEEMET